MGRMGDLLYGKSLEAWPHWEMILWYSHGEHVVL